MKKLYTTLVAVIAIAHFSYAQNTPWSTTGSIGIGTTSPGQKLDVAGNIALSTGGYIYGDSSTPYLRLSQTYGSFLSYGPSLLYLAGSVTTLSAGSSYLGLITNGNERMRIDNNGNVGIGATNPTGLLHLYSSSSANDMFLLQFNASGGGNWAINPFISGVSNGGLSFVDKQHSTTPVVISNDGNIGIGITNPDRSLMIKGTTGGGAGDNAFHGTIRLDDATALAADNGAGVTFGYTYTGTSQTYGPFIRGYKSTATDSEVGGGLKLGVRGDSGNPFTVMTLDKTGNVGIGTTTPDTKLAVNGTIHTKEVKVDLTGWPDYVFKPKYNLPSLTDVKNYTDKNQHLPDMPSEQEVEKNGINLGEIVKIQTKKIEELTLYLIEKEKELTEQKQVNQSQQKVNRSLQQQIDQLAKKMNN